MNAEELKRKVATLSIWKKNGQRAPHKPLLLLLALSRLQDDVNLLPYEGHTLEAEAAPEGVRPRAIVVSSGVAVRPANDRWHLAIERSDRQDEVQ